jgi:uncharacterized protein YggE
MDAIIWTISIITLGWLATVAALFLAHRSALTLKQETLVSNAAESTLRKEIAALNAELSAVAADATQANKAVEQLATEWREVFEKFKTERAATLTQMEQWKKGARY